MTTIREAMDTLPKERSDYYRNLMGTKVSMVMIKPSTEEGADPDQIEVKMIFERKCEDGTLDHHMTFTARSGKIIWPKEGAADDT